MADTREAPQGETETMMAQLWAELLGLEQVGRRDNFFELGGHSVLAMGMLSRLGQRFGVELELSDLFRRPELAAFAEALDGVKANCTPATSLAAGGSHPLSPAQQRIWFVDQMAGGGGAYNLCWAVRLHGKVFPAALEQAVGDVQRRQHVLRSTFVLTDQGPVQRVQSSLGPSCVRRLDLGSLAEPEREAEVQRLIRTEARARFDLENEPPLRVHLVRLSHAESVLLVSMHHIASDGWSQEIFFADLAEYYSAHTQGTSARLAPLARQYVEVAEAERQWLQSGEFEKELGFWKRQLESPLESDQLPLDHPRPDVPVDDGAVESAELPPELLKNSHILSRSEGVTLFMTLLAAFQVLLHRLNGKMDIVVGTDIATRARADTVGLIGLFVNQVILRTDMSGRPSFREVMRRVKRVTLDAYEHQRVPFDRLVQELSPTRDVGRNPLFQAMFILHSHSPASVQLPGLRVEPIRVPLETSPFDITMAFAETRSGKLYIECRYKRALFEGSTIRNLLANLGGLIDAAAMAPDIAIDELKLVNGEQLSGEEDRRSRRKKHRLQKLLTAQPRQVTESVDDVWKVEPLAANQETPVMVRPRIKEGVDLVTIARDYRDRIDQLLRRHGAVLFRSFGMASVSRLRAFTDALTLGPLPYKERSSRRTSLGEHIYTSTDHPADQPIVLHNEQSYALEWPMKILFGCLEPPEHGGCTPLADSRRTLLRLNEATIRTFEDKGVMYIRNYGGGMGLPWQEAFQTEVREDVEAFCSAAQIELQWRSNGQLRTCQRRPAIRTHPVTGERVWFNHAYFFNVGSLDDALRDSLLAGGVDVMDLPFQSFYGDGSTIPQAVLDEIRGAFDAETVTFPWEKGDLLLVDNMLVAHGREPYAGRRSIAVAMADPFHGLATAAV